MRLPISESGGWGGVSVWSIIFPSIQERDGKIIKTFLDTANGKYRKLIIDVRNNSGGSPYYVYENLVSPFLDERVTYDQVVGIRRKYRDNLKRSVLKTLRKFCSGTREHVVSTEEIEAPEGFDASDWIFYRLTRKIEPRNRHNFDGSIYVLTNGNSFSATDDYANAVKRIGFARLTGRNSSGGCAAYIGPPAIRLPASGMIFRVETELLINPDGSINELFGTPPDIQLEPADPPKSITKEELLKDEWIKWILADSQYCTDRE
jgi:C-terminal processing protease CtpA/Prc